MAAQEEGQEMALHLDASCSLEELRSIARGCANISSASTTQPPRKDIVISHIAKCVGNSWERLGSVLENLIVHGVPSSGRGRPATSVQNHARTVYSKLQRFLPPLAEAAAPPARSGSSIAWQVWRDPGGLAAGGGDVAMEDADGGASASGEDSHGDPWDLDDEEKMVQGLQAQTLGVNPPSLTVDISSHKMVAVPNTHGKVVLIIARDVQTTSQGLDDDDAVLFFFAPEGCLNTHNLASQIERHAADVLKDRRGGGDLHKSNCGGCIPKFQADGSLTLSPSSGLPELHSQARRTLFKWNGVEVALQRNLFPPPADMHSIEGKFDEYSDAVKGLAALIFKCGSVQEVFKSYLTREAPVEATPQDRAGPEEEGDRGGAPAKPKSKRATPLPQVVRMFEAGVGDPDEVVRQVIFREKSGVKPVLNKEHRNKLEKILEFQIQVRLQTPLP
eukprot:CAMPEP_0174951126 /NCGR_PEP_ID=MMETSP1355-20121228/94688_1 /TAXON_ID=464990 /ORGANISM="Hemiselmis tepida, Strain CCMP443" /LENGTH=445 /DNA_ID=CAMNT_0016198773 /DNA_START=947 /DNA_END=2280 /DNA_ORIENTATION=+